MQQELHSRLFTHPSVEEVRQSLRERFHWMDYVMLGVMLMVCLGMGVYYGFFKVSNTTQEYLIGGKRMKLWPIGASLVASFISGISMLGIPTETYFYGNGYMYLILGLLIMTIIFERCFLPVFYNLQLTSIYEYLERRFDRKVRVFGSFLFTVYITLWLSIVIYVPALAFNQVTGINVHVLTPIICVICIFYTCLGGLQAVVSTDFVQSFLMIGSIILVSVKGSLDIGGFGVVWERNVQSGRITLPKWEVTPYTRYTIWSSTLGILFEYLHGGGLNQTVTQRLFALPSLKAAKQAMWINFFGLGLILLISGYSGLLIYATFHNCDPLQTKLAGQNDQLLPLLVMNVLGGYPGLIGIFIAGILSASLSSLSTGLNSMSAVVVEDFYVFFFANRFGKLSERQEFMIMRISVVVFGGICVGMVYIIENLGSIMQLHMVMGSVSAGASLGLFLMGVLCPWVTSKGVLAGGFTSMAFMTWFCINARQEVAVDRWFHLQQGALSIDGCNYHFTPINSTSGYESSNPDDYFTIFNISFLFYNCLGTLIAIIVGIGFSFATGANNPQDMDLALLAPFYTKFIKKRDFPNQPNDGIIFAYNEKEQDKTDIKLVAIKSNE